MISLTRPFKLGIILAAAVLLALAAYHTPRPAQAVFQDSDGDGAIDIAEVISSSDPNNANSIPEGTTAEFISGLPLCSDGVDNDLDGMVDVADSGCHDSDNDLIADSLETAVGSDPNNAASFPEDSRFDAAAEYYGFPLHWCGDRFDNDGDGLVDGADPGCTPIRGDNDAFDDATEKRFGSNPADPNSVPEHELANPGSCSDGMDNDRDGMTDSADPACQIPNNDDRANATTISTLPYSSGPTVMKNASVESGERGSSCNYGSLVGTVWYSFTPSSDTVVIADTVDSNFGTVIAAWTNAGGRLQEVACDFGYAPPSLGGQARIAFRAVAGRTYYLQVDGTPYPSPFATLPTLTFHLSTGSPPSNDQLQDAALIGSLPFNSSVATDNATTQPGEPHPICSYDNLSSSVWYKYAPASDTLLVIDTEGSNFHSVVQAYMLTKFGLGPVACATSEPQGIPLPVGQIPSSEIALQATAGQTYYIQVSGLAFGIPFGNLSFHAAVGVPPANDNFASARAIGSLPYTDTVDILTGRMEDGEPAPSCVYSPQGPTVWYRYTAPSNGGLLLDTEGSSFYYAFLAVYQGSALNNLTQIACGTPYSTNYAEVGIQVAAGQTYYIQAGGSGSFVGPPLLGAEAGGVVPIPVVGGNRLVLNAEVLDIPSCPTAQFTYSDPTGDTNNFGGVTPPPGGPVQRDITSVGVSTTAQNVCLSIAFNGHIDPPDASGDSFLLYVSFDADANLATGYQGDLDYACGQPALLGTELSLSTYSTAGILIPYYPIFVSPAEPLPGGPVEIEEANYAILLVHDRTAQLILPLSAIGGDSTFNFALYAGSNNYGPTDCAPNGGHVSCVNGACTAFQTLLGDANCDGSVNAVDATLILQLNAGMIRTVPCPQLADANRNGGVGPVDATLILQFSAGALPALS